MSQVHTSSIYSPDGNRVPLAFDEPKLPFANSPAYEPWRPTLPFQFDQEGFLRYSSTTLLWMPVSLRGAVDMHQSSVDIRGRSGAVTILRWPVALSRVGCVSVG